MVRKVVIAVVALALLAAGALYFYAQAILGSDLVRRQVESQLTASFGQPVAIGRISATIVPRVTVRLGDVRIGAPARVAIATLDLGTSFSALLSRRIEHATARVDGARIELPLPVFAFQSAAATSTSDTSAVTITSIDEILLHDVELVSGGRSLRADVDVVPHGAGMTLRSVRIGAGEAAVDITGEIEDLSGPTGTLAIRAGSLNLLDLVAFASDFSTGLPGPAPAAAPAPPASTMNLTASIAADRAVIGTLVLDKLEGRAQFAGDRLLLTPVTFGVFGGAYNGSLDLGLDAGQAFSTRAALTDIDMAALMAFVGQPDLVTGRLTGDLTVSGTGLDPGAVTRTATGTMRASITQGTVRGLGLVRTAVTALSGRADAATAAPNAGAEPFSRLGGSFTIDGGTARTADLQFESNDVLLSATGTVALDGSRIDLSGPLQLSDALTQQAGRDLVRYTQDDGRVTIPARISGPASALQVSVDTAALLKRALTNRATEEAGDAIRRGLGGLLGR